MGAASLQGLKEEYDTKDKYDGIHNALVIIPSCIYLFTVFIEVLFSCYRFKFNIKQLYYGLGLLYIACFAKLLINYFIKINFQNT